MREYRRYWFLFFVLLIVVSGGCLDKSVETETQNGSVQSTFTTTPLILPDNISFNVELEVLQGSRVVVNYSYSGRIVYSSKNGIVSLKVVFNPGNKQLTGNWHYKEIVVENGTMVRILNVPPASWSSLPENESSEIVEEIFYQNPYKYLFEIIKDHGGISGDGNFSVELSSNECMGLLAPLMWEDSPPHIPLKGWVILENGTITKAHFVGIDGDKEYIFNLEVVG